MKDNSNDAKMFGKYVKHWGELKGFALALEAGKRSKLSSKKVNKSDGLWTLVAKLFSGS